MASTWDVTRAGHGRRTSDALLRKAEAIAGLGSWMLELGDLDDINANPLHWSDGVYRIFGYEPRAFDASNDAFFRAVHPDDAEMVKAAVVKAIADRTEYLVVHRIIRPDGTERVVEERASIDYDESGRPQGLVGTVLDITDRVRIERDMKRMEIQLQMSQRLESVGRLSAGIAHDFNNLLTAITGYGELALMELPGDHPARDDVKGLLEAAQRAATLTRQLLAFGRRLVLQPSMLDLRIVVQELAPILRRIAGDDVTVTITAGDAPVPVFADRAQVEQVLVNLAANAKDAMPQGGQLRVDVSSAEVEAGALSTQSPIPAGSYARIRVSDTGVGMDPEVQARAFEPFFTTKGRGRGSGMGLATVYGVVKQSGGHVTMESEVGRGTTFEVFLPATEADSA